MKMKLPWCIKHPKMFILVTIACQLRHHITLKWRHTFQNSAIKPSWISKLFRDVRKSPNLTRKNQEKYKNAKKRRRLFVKCENLTKTENLATLSKQTPNLGKTTCISKSIMVYFSFRSSGCSKVSFWRWSDWRRIMGVNLSVGNQKMIKYNWK